MAQTQKYEKVVILNSSLDSRIFDNNSSYKFKNRIFPINQDQSYDAVFPMMTSVPLIKVPPEPEPGIKLYRLNERGRKMFQNWYILNDSVIEIKLNCVSIGIFNNVYLPMYLKFGIRMKPRIDISKHVFQNKPNIAPFCDFFLYVTHGNNEKNATEDFIVIAPNDNPMLGCLKPKREIGRHLYWQIIKGQQMEWELTGNFENDGSAKVSIGIVNDMQNNIAKKRTWVRTDLELINWAGIEIDELLEVMNQDSSSFGYFELYFRNLTVTFPENIWEEIEFGPRDISDDNQQIYVHCDNINLNRIANQNEPIFQDLFISKNALLNGRLTDYLSIPNNLPLTLNSQIVSELSFELLNAVGEPNDFIDLERSTIIICKLIKKYYDFSDGKKKTYLTNVFTY